MAENRELTRSPEYDFNERSGSTTTQSPRNSNQDSASIAANNQRARARPGQSLRYSDISAPTSPVETPDSRAPQKPPIRRRSSGRQYMPYRGQEFSADDASQEVDEDAARVRQSRATAVSRRQSSTVRRRAAATPARLPLIESQDSDEENRISDVPEPAMNDVREDESSGDATVQADEAEVEREEEDSGTSSDAESFTLKDRQDAINETHPFGIRIWKPALYKKGRSVEKEAEVDIHSAPGGHVTPWLWLGNLTWIIVFGWWLAIIAAFGALICHLFALAPGCIRYGRVLWGFSRYIFYPFGKYVKLIQEDAYAEEDRGEGRTVGEFEQWQSGDIEEGRLFFGPVRSLIGRRRSQDDSDEDESTSLLRREQNNQNSDNERSRTKKRPFGRGKWTLGRVIYFVFFYGLLAPLLLIVSAICWFLVFTIPMGRLTLILLDHLRRHPLALEFHSDHTSVRAPGAAASSVLLCTYRAVGVKYWKYTIDGTNVILINLLAVVAFVIFDYWVLFVGLGLNIPVTNTILVFLLALFSIIPLAYFIGQAVASISAQSTMGVGAAINAFFSTIVEVFLYCVALKEGKAQLVEGSIIGSVFAGVLFLPGLSMCFGAFKRKTQRFNVKSAGVTSTMLLFAVIGAFSPTLFYQIYGTHELSCQDCDFKPGDLATDTGCRRCYFSQVPTPTVPFYVERVRPYCWFAAVLLFLSYVVGLLFTLRTHAAVIWNAEIEEKRQEKRDQVASSQNYGSISGPPRKQQESEIAQVFAPISTNLDGARNIRDTPLYKRVLGQSLRQAGVKSSRVEPTSSKITPSQASVDAAIVDKSLSKGILFKSLGLSEEASQALALQMAELAATAATVAARDALESTRRVSSHHSSQPSRVSAIPSTNLNSSSSALRHDAVPTQTPDMLAPATIAPGGLASAEPHEQSSSGGHDAPNWSRAKSYAILLTATVAYAVIAEILVDTVDSVLNNVDIDEKFLGITLFALVPNTTEFLNAISFAMNGNIALSMEIGSAYALQVCLLQIPALVLFSAIASHFFDPTALADHTFTLLFPQWDMVTVVLCVFLLSYVYGEGKSNYFKGSVLILSYLVVIAGFFLAGLDDISGEVSETWGRRIAGVPVEPAFFRRSVVLRADGSS